MELPSRSSSIFHCSRPFPELLESFQELWIDASFPADLHTHDVRLCDSELSIDGCRNLLQAWRYLYACDGVRHRIVCHARVVIVGELQDQAWAMSRPNRGSRVAATIMAALLFAQSRISSRSGSNKFFYRDRVMVRRAITLIDVGRTLGSEVRSENMLGLIVDRLSRALSVDRTALFWRDQIRQIRFNPAYISDFTIAFGCGSFLSPERSTERPYLFFNEVNFPD